MTVGDAWDSSWTLDDLLGVAGADTCFSNHQVILFLKPSGWPLRLAVILFLLDFLGQTDESFMSS